MDMANGKTSRAATRSFELQSITLVVNGETHELNVGAKPGEIEVFHTLAHTLRETLGLTGTKISCDNGACGACTVSWTERRSSPARSLRSSATARDHHHRRAEGPRDGGARPPAAGIHRPYCLPVRLLHAGHDHDVEGAPQQKPAPD